MTSTDAVIENLRKKYHSKLQNTIWGISANDIPSNADSHHRTSVAIARSMLEEALMPSRLASLALGTGDIDCVYHMALNEMKIAIDGYKSKDETAADMFDTLVLGRRLRDISDLPFDLAT